MASIGLVCLLFFINWCPASCDTYTEFLAKTLPDLCPYSTFCTMGPSKEFKHKHASPCCKACSCDDDCLFYGNCCPDHPTHREKSPIVMPTASCSAPIHYGYDGFEADLEIYHHLSLGFYFHYIVSTCPLGYSDQEVINKCVNINIQNMWGSVMVSDGKGHAFYNQYCARCNGVQSFTKWDLKLFCWKYTDKIMNVHDLQALDENQCMLMSSPPTENIALASRCFSVRFDQCNMTRIWKTFDPHIQQACESTTFPFVIDKYAEMVAYKNIYCHLCNPEDFLAVADVPAVADVCQPDIIKQGWRQFERPYFSALLEGDPVVRVSTGKPKCQTSYIYDIHFKKCRLLRCPFSLLSLDGKCVNVFKMTLGMTIFTQVNVTYGNEVTRRVYSVFNRNPSDHVEPFETIANQLYNSLGMKSYGCGKCVATAFVNSDYPGVLFNLGFVNNKRCSVSTIIDMVDKWRQKAPNVSVNMDTQQMVFVPALTYDWDNQDMVEQITLLRHEFQAYSENANRLWPMFYCAHVDLSPSEYTEILSSSGNTVQVSDFAAIGNETDHGNSTSSYRICIDKYLPHTNGEACINTNRAGRILTATLIGILVVPW